MVSVGGLMIGWLTVGIAMVRGRRPSQQARTRHRNRTALLGIVLQGAGMELVFGWRRPPLGQSTLGWSLAALSVVTALVAAIFVLSAIRTLGRQWSLLPRVIDVHVLVADGPYAVVRHPIYTGLLGMLIATGLALGWSLAIPAAVVLYLAGAAVRIRIEEALLAQVFGDQYARYRARVPAILPFARRLAG